VCRVIKMSIRELYHKHYDELTVASQTLIETTDDRTLETLGDFNSPYDFNLYVAENFS
jgi:hypothetical protein